MGGTSIETGYSITADASGNIYTTGNFSGNVDFDPGPGVFNLSTNGTADIFISKSDSAGNFIWAKQMEGSIYAYSIAIALDAFGNIYTTGSFAGGVDFDPGPGVFNLSAGGTDVFVSKLDSAGNFIWVKQMWAGSGNSIAIDVYGNVLVTGFIRNSSAYTQIFILKLNAAGNTVWSKQIGGVNSACSGSSITTDGAGNVYTAGYFSINPAVNPIDFDPGPGVYNIYPVGGADIFVSKLNAAGNFVWSKQMGGTQFEEGNSITVDASGNVITTGYFNGTVDFDPGPAVFNLSSFGDEDIFVSKFNAAGNFIWAKQMGGIQSEEGNSLAVDAAGNVYITGHFYGTADFDPGSPVYNLVSAGFSDIFISKLDGNGNFRWAKSIGGSQYDWSYALALDATGNIYTTGYFDGIVDFDIGPGVYNLSSVGSKDIFVLKLNRCFNGTFSAITVSTCNAYILNGQTYSTSGIYLQSLINTAGCDSIITLNLTINNRYTTLNAAVCDSYLWNGQTYTSTGIYRDTLTASNGCDSIITLNLVINSRTFSAINAAICSGQNYAGYTTAGTYIDTLVAANGCDSIRTLKLIEKTKSFSTIDTTICSGQNYGGHTTTGTYVDILAAANGCDSIRTLNLTVKNNCSIYIPNAFTPNKDGLNDLFKPTINLSFQQFSFIIFNRYGQKIFETREYGKGWDGTYKGKDQPTGSYVYRIKFTNSFGWKSENNGTVLLIR